MGKVTNFAKMGNFIASLCKEFVTPPWFTGKAKQYTVLFFFRFLIVVQCIRVSASRDNLSYVRVRLRVRKQFCYILTTKGQISLCICTV